MKGKLCEFFPKIYIPLTRSTHLKTDSEFDILKCKSKTNNCFTVLTNGDSTEAQKRAVQQMGQRPALRQREWDAAVATLAPMGKPQAQPARRVAYMLAEKEIYEGTP